MDFLTFLVAVRRAVKSWFGVVEHDVDGILSGFRKTLTRLEDAVHHHVDVANAADQTAAVARAAAERASTAALKLGDLIG